MTDRVTDRVRVVVHHARFAATLARSIEAKLADRVLVDVNVDEARDPPALADADVLVGFRFPRGLGARMPKLRFVQLTGMGRDVVATLELDAHVRVDDIGDVHARAVAEHAMLALLLARSRGTAIGNVVVLGAGRVGSAIATRARAFGWHTIGLARTTRERDGFAAVTTSLHALRQADAVVIALPLTPETRGLVDAEALAMLPRHAALVDISRGGVVVEAELGEAF